MERDEQSIEEKERGQVKEAEKSSEIGNSISRKIVPWRQIQQGEVIRPISNAISA